MDFSIDLWMHEYVEAVKRSFEERIWFIGLQGSYGRGEATENSDIDVVLILDKISCDDLEKYSAALDTLSERSRICGFVSGKEELLAWEPSDLFQFYYDTKPIYGSLEVLSEKIRKEDVIRAVRIGACNIYHMCVHNIVHEKSTDILKGLYKSASFSLQAVAFLDRGVYAKKKTDVLKLLIGKDKTILEINMLLKNKDKISEKEFKHFSEQLIVWASEQIKERAELF